MVQDVEQEEKDSAVPVPSEVNNSPRKKKSGKVQPVMDSPVQSPWHHDGEVDYFRPVPFDESTSHLASTLTSPASPKRGHSDARKQQGGDHWVPNGVSGLY